MGWEMFDSRARMKARVGTFSVLLCLPLAAWSADSLDARLDKVLLDTPLIDATTIGKNADRKIRKIAARSPTPKKMIATGIQAMGLIGRKSCIVGLTT